MDPEMRKRCLKLAAAHRRAMEKIQREMEPIHQIEFGKRTDAQHREIEGHWEVYDEFQMALDEIESWLYPPVVDEVMLNYFQSRLDLRLLPDFDYIS
jgi:hypothetical protein